MQSLMPFSGVSAEGRNTLRQRSFEDRYDYDPMEGLFLPKEKSFSYDRIGKRNMQFVVANAGGFSPLDISSLTQWIDFDDSGSRTLNGDDISAQDDLKNGNDVTQTTATEQSLFVASGINSIGCSEGDGGLASKEHYDVTNDTLSALTAAEMFIILELVEDPPGATANAGLYKYGTHAATITVVPWTDGNIYDGFGTTVRKSTGNPTLSFTSPRCYNVVTTSSEWTSEVDGAQHYTNATNTVGFRTDPLLGKEDRGTEHYYHGQIGEFILFNAKLSSGDKASMETYIADKWGITFA